MRGQLNRELATLAQLSVFDRNFSQIKRREIGIENIVIAHMN